MDCIELTIDEVVFRSEDGRFTVVRGTNGSEAGALTAVGDLGQVQVGETLRLTGRFTEHAQYGRRFQVASFTPVVPSSRDGLVRYLGSGLVPGVGKSLAERLVAKFGEKTLDVITTQSGRLTEVSGIGKSRAQALAEAIRARRSEAESLSYLHGLGLGPKAARRLLKRYGDAAARVVRDDPYLVAEEVSGIGFRTADAIGRRAGIALSDPRRAAGALLHLLGKGADDGHVFVRLAALRDGARELDVPPELIEAVIPTLVDRNMIVVDGDAIYAPPLHRAERAVAERLKVLASPRRVADPARADAAIADLPLTTTQREAVRISLASGLSVLTGGPGTGKTTTVRAIVRAHVALGHRVLLAAPTGRAAKRLSEATGYEAKTIHRMLEWNPAAARFKRDASAPLDAELVLVDEASMLDLPLADALIAAIAPSSRLLLVGDVHQLPPVGPGPVLRDVIASGLPTIVRLVEVFRQAQESAIVRGAHAILEGALPEPTPSGTKGRGDLFLVRASSPEAIASRLLEVLTRLPEAYGFDPKRDVQVLAPTRRGPVGTERLNALLQDALNPGPSRGDAVVLRPGDKVMQLRNDYDRDVFNGDLGEVQRVEGGVTYVRVDGREVQYDLDAMDALTLAYASTVHKVQGSEFPAAILVLHPSHHLLLTRALVYTAITRAQRLVVLLGDEQAMRRAIRNVESRDVNSKLEALLRPPR